MKAHGLERGKNSGNRRKVRIDIGFVLWIQHDSILIR